MTKKSDELLNQCLEIEGLLALISKREDNTPQMVYEMLRDKTAELSASAAELYAGLGVEAEAGTDACISASTDETAIADAAEEEEMADADIDKDPFASLPTEPVDVNTPVVEADSIDDKEDYSDSIPSTAVIEDENNISVVESEVAEFDTVVVDYESTIKGEDTQPNTIQAEEPMLPPAEELLELPKPEVSVDEVSVEPIDYEDETQQPVLSDKFAEFTLNDKFRFRRELFGNSDIDMNEALDVVNAMSSRDEVEDYFYNDMCWDPANDDVRDFMRIVTAKFN